MNCANHPDAANVAFCRTCGKPLCANCTRDVRGVIYCESCLAARMEGQAPAAAFVDAAQPSVPVVPGTPAPGAPNPAIAGILAGFFPVGVGAVYNGQYAKGLAHLGIFVLLVMGFSENRPWYINAALGISLGFFYVYQIIDAIRGAHAIAAGQPAPDPFGLGQAFSAGPKVDPSRVPVAAIVLIGLGLLFLLQTAGLFDFGWDRVWPLLLIGLGVWLFARRQGMFGAACDRRGRPFRARGMVGPAMLITVGVLSLIESLDGPHWDRTWPVLLLVLGLTKLLESHSAGKDLAPPAPPADSGMPQVPEPPSSEVKNG